MTVAIDTGTVNVKGDQIGTQHNLGDRPSTLNPAIVPQPVEGDRSASPIAENPVDDRL